MATLAAVTVNRKAEERLRAGHVWIFSSDVTARDSAGPGDVVEVRNERGRPLGIAHYSSTSQIVLRMLSDNAQDSLRDVLLRRMSQAIEYRKRLAPESDAYRLIYAEGDLLPGLIIDRYGDYFSAQFLSQGMDRARDLVLECLRELLPVPGLVARNDAPVRRLENLPLEVTMLCGEVPERVPVRLNGLALEADLVRGQKTGIFLDQRENYVAAARAAKGRALDAFSSTGGFALHAAARCESVEAVDSSAEALRMGQANAERNGIANITFKEANVFDLLSGYTGARRSFDTIILDPPAFAKSRKAMEAAMRGYKEINFKALRLLSPGGTLVTCSCSHHVSEAMLMETVSEAARDAGRRLRLLEQRIQGRDHPVLLGVPETLYLKCLILEAI